MNKVATYLNEHLAGEVIVSGNSIAKNSTDKSQLLIAPEMIAQVANTNDIRKIMRFCWQLAEKGHTLSVTARGRGTSATGASIGSGIIISPAKYMNRIIGIDPKQKLVHIQSGAMYSGVTMTLSTHSGMRLPSISNTQDDGTVGGSVASGATGFMISRYGRFGDSVKQLEVVLANGDILQTSRLNKRDVNAKKGLHTFEGEIYRQVDNLISDNQELINSLETSCASGYNSIAKVKKKDGSIDLSPLFIGSEGTLGVVSEVILQSQFARRNLSVVIGAFETFGDAHVAVDVAKAAKAAMVNLIDGRLVKRAAAQGKKREFAPEASYKGGLVVAVFDDFAERTRTRVAKKLERDIAKSAGFIKATVLNIADSDASEISSILFLAKNPAAGLEVVPGAFDGIWLPPVQLSSFFAELTNIEKEFSVELPAFVDIYSGLIDLLPVFDMKKVTDRQKMIRVLSAVSDAANKHGGSLSGSGGEGRLKSLVTYAGMNEAEAELYEKIKNIFDPHGILNPGVKQKILAKDVASQLNAWCREAA